MRGQVPSTDVGPTALGAINARPTVVIDYAPNPRNPGAQIIRDALVRLHGFLVPAVLGGDTDPGLQYHGLTAPAMQDFKGAVNPAATRVVYRDGSADISSAVVAGPMGDPARRIFADRLRRRQGM